MDTIVCSESGLTPFADVARTQAVKYETTNGSKQSSYLLRETTGEIGEHTWMETRRTHLNRLGWGIQGAAAEMIVKPNFWRLLQGRSTDITIQRNAADLGQCRSFLPGRGTLSPYLGANNRYMRLVARFRAENWL